METEKFRILHQYRYNGKEVIKTVHLCDISTVDSVYKKLKRRGTIIALGKGTWCDDCRLTGCWDHGHAIMCNIKKRVDK